MKYFCSLPWTGLNIDTQGNFRPCCKYESSIAESYKAYVASAELTTLKQQFLAGDQPAGCSRCWKDETAGLMSLREIELRYKFNNQHPALENIRLLTLSFGNTCNLSCRTCSSFSSSKWTQIEKSLPAEYQPLVIHNHKKFYKNTAFIDELKLHVLHATDIEFAGGEPFIAGIKEQIEFLDYLISKGLANNISLTYITNCTVFPTQDFWDRWHAFKKVTFLLSVDGVGDKFEYLRWPARWDQCFKNIKKYQGEQKHRNNLILAISHTVSIFNVLDLPQFLVWCLKNQLPAPYIGMADEPQYLNIQHLSDKAKEEITLKLSTISKLLSVVNYMNGSAADLTNDTIAHIQLHDQARQQDFHTVFPEISKIIFR